MAAESSDVRAADLGGGVFVAVATPQAAGVTAPPATAGRKWRVRAPHCMAAAAAAAVAIARLGTDPQGFLAAGVLAVLVILAAIDLRWRLLPNRIVIPATGAVLAYQLAFNTGDTVECVVASIGAAALLLVPGLLQPGAVGMGDVKLAGLLGATLGAKVLGALLSGLLLSAPVAAYILLRHGRRARHRSLPMGPFLAVGAAVVLLG